MANYDIKLANELAAKNSRIKAAKSFYYNYAKYLEKYRGGMHSGFLAAIAQWESGGSLSASGDPALGELGFFQVASSTPDNFGLPNSIRNTAEGNIFIGCLEYNVTAAKLYLQFPKVIQLGSVDNWMLARLGFAIGMGGLKSLLTKSNLAYGQVYRSLLDYINHGGAISLGSQSAELVQYRINAVALQWEIGMSVTGSYSKIPSRIPSPSGVSYTIPRDVAKVLGSSSLTSAALSLMGMGVALNYFG